MIFDSHAHYDDSQFDEDRDSLLSSTLKEKEVIGIINCSSSFSSIAKTLALCDKFDMVFGSVGIHPQDANEIPSNYLDAIKNSFANKKIVAIGEIGLDYYYQDSCPRDIQKRVFEEQLKLAKELQKPIIVHDRDAHQDTLDYLKKHSLNGVIHCFSGSSEMALEVVKLGYYIGLGGVVTFNNARHSVEVAKAIPLERILLETDSPYLSPVPNRGKRNDSSNIIYTATKIAQIKDCSLSEVLEQSRNNVKKLFGI